MISLGEAQDYVRSTLMPLEPVEVPLGDALGCVTAERVIAREPVPGFDNSSMDGYALRAADTVAPPVTLRVTGTIFAGDATSSRLSAGEAMRIMTGAPMPAGADSVCMIEEAVDDEVERIVVVKRTIAAGEFVRHPGDDIGVGQILFEPGVQLVGAQIGVLASQGFESVRVHRQPCVGVLSTGNELSGPGGALETGKIRDTNRPMLLALLRESGFTARDLGISRDDPASIAEALQRGVDTCDVVVATGGVSVGDVDYVKTVLADICGGQARWMQVAIRPGKPFAFGVAGSNKKPIFGLAGNPVSTRVGFEMFVRPTLRYLAGHPMLERTTVNMILDCPIKRSRDGKLYLVHVVSQLHDDGQWHIESAARQGSHLLSAVAAANALAMVPDGEDIEIGGNVRALLLHANVSASAGNR
jgi:molybdopterin molybdotransferase